MAYDMLYDNIGILAVPPQIGATNEWIRIEIQPDARPFWRKGLAGGGSGIQVLDGATARARLQLDSARRQVSLFDQLELGRAAFLREGLRRRNPVRRDPRNPSGRSKQNQPPISFNSTELLANVPATAITN